VPHTRRDLVRLIEADPVRFMRKVVTYDLENSGLGFLLATQDAQTADLLWDVARALGKARAREVPTTAAMLQSLASGESALAYNVLGAYAQAKIRETPSIGFVHPQDYTLVGTRIAFISKRAAHPDAARLWLDHLLSKRGQSVLAKRSGLFAVRRDAEPEPPAATSDPGAPVRPRPIAIGPSLMAYLDRHKRQDFLKQWKRALARQ
jgi:iron(III) transport system substrate-binding protein